MYFCLYELKDKEGFRMKKQPFVVGPETVRMLELGHPWVIADRFTRKWPSAKAGDVVELDDEQGKLLATALLDPADRVVARVLAQGPLRLDQAWLPRRHERAAVLRSHESPVQDALIAPNKSPPVMRSFGNCHRR
jgi:23S rRNA (cytosine1962-C5)-methyltransferase